MRETTITYKHYCKTIKRELHRWVLLDLEAGVQRARKINSSFWCVRENVCRARGGARGWRRRRAVGARRLLRSEHLRPRSVAPLVACSSPAPAPAPASRGPAPRRRPRHGTLPAARRSLAAARPPLRLRRRPAAPRQPPAGFVISRGRP